MQRRWVYWLSQLMWIALAGCTFEASCGGRTKRSVISSLKTAVAGELGASVEKLDCPTLNAKVEDGDYSCTVTIETTQLAIKLTITGDNLHFEAPDALLRSNAEAAIRKMLSQQQVPADAKIACPGPAVRAVAIGESIPCSVTIPPQSAIEFEWVRKRATYFETRGLSVREAYERRQEQKLRKDAGDPNLTVECAGPPVYLAKPGPGPACVIRSDGREFSYTVQIDKSRTHFMSKLVRKPRLQAQIAAKAKEILKVDSISVDCQSPFFIVPRPGHRIVCQLSSGTTQDNVVIQFKDDAGGWQVVE